MKKGKELFVLDIIEGIVSLFGIVSFLLLSIVVDSELKYVFLIIGVQFGFNFVSLIENMLTLKSEKNKEEVSKNIKAIESI